MAAVQARGYGNPRYGCRVVAAGMETRATGVAWRPRVWEPALRVLPWVAAGMETRATGVVWWPRVWKPALRALPWGSRVWESALRAE